MPMDQGINFILPVQSTLTLEQIKMWCAKEVLEVESLEI